MTYNSSVLIVRSRPNIAGCRPFFKGKEKLKKKIKNCFPPRMDETPRPQARQSWLTTARNCEKTAHRCVRSLDRGKYFLVCLMKWFACTWGAVWISTDRPTSFTETWVWLALLTVAGPEMRRYLGHVGSSEANRRIWMLTRSRKRRRRHGFSAATDIGGKTKPRRVALSTWPCKYLTVLETKLFMPWAAPLI